MQRIARELLELDDNARAARIAELTTQDAHASYLRLVATHEPDLWTLEDGIPVIPETVRWDHPDLLHTLDELDIEDDLVVETYAWEDFYHTVFLGRDGPDSPDYDPAPSIEDGMLALRLWFRENREVLREAFGDFLDWDEQRKFADSEWIDLNGTWTGLLIPKAGIIAKVEREHLLHDALGFVKEDDQDLLTAAIRGETPGQDYEADKNIAFRIADSMLSRYALLLQEKPEGGWTVDNTPKVPQGFTNPLLFIPDTEAEEHLRTPMGNIHRALNDLIRTEEYAHLNLANDEMNLVVGRLAAHTRVAPLLESTNAMNNAIEILSGKLQWMEEHVLPFLRDEERANLIFDAMASGSDLGLRETRYRAEATRAIMTTMAVAWGTANNIRVHITQGAGGLLHPFRGSIDPYLGNERFMNRAIPQLHEHYRELLKEDYTDEVKAKIDRLRDIDLRRLLWGNLHATLLQPDANDISDHPEIIRLTKEVLAMDPYPDDDLWNARVRQQFQTTGIISARYAVAAMDAVRELVAPGVTLVTALGTTARPPKGVLKVKDLGDGHATAVIRTRADPVDPNDQTSHDRTLSPEDLSRRVLWELAMAVAPVGEEVLGLTGLGFNPKDMIPLTGAVRRLMETWTSVSARMLKRGRAITESTWALLSGSDPSMIRMHQSFELIETMPSVEPIVLLLHWALGESDLRRSGWRLFPVNEQIPVDPDVPNEFIDLEALHGDMVRVMARRDPDENQKAFVARRWASTTDNVVGLRRRFGDHRSLQPTPEAQRIAEVATEENIRALRRIYDHPAIKGLPDDEHEITLEEALEVMTLIQDYMDSVPWAP